MSSRPRNTDGEFVEAETVESDGEVIFYMREFEARVIGNRLERAAGRSKNLLGDLDAPIQLSQDCSYWSEKFLSACSTRAECDAKYYKNGEKRHTNADRFVRVKMSDYECWSLGNRLYEIGNWFKQKGYEKVGQESEWLARRFHAEKKEQIDNE